MNVIHSSNNILGFSSTFEDYSSSGAEAVLGVSLTFGRRNIQTIHPIHTFPFDQRVQDSIRV